MPQFKIAHIREQGIDLIITPVDPAFEYKSQEDQSEAVAKLQERAESANLAGTVVPVWTAHGGRLRFRAPRQWHPFFQSLTPARVASCINKTLRW